MAGADITYLYAGTPGSPNDWLVRLTFYRDCSGIAAPTVANICVQSASLGTAFSVSAPNISVTAIGSSACVTSPANNCPGGVGDVERYVYETLVTLPAPATDWTFAWGDCCRNPGITTGLSNAGMYVNSSLNSMVAPTDNSPQFTTLAYTRFCVGNAFYYDNGAVDPDGDSLSFALVPALEGSTFSCPAVGTNCNYTNPYSGTNPLSSSIPITIDPQTGVINFVPNIIQVAVIAVLVTEYRNGIEIGTVRRDIQINVISQCNQINPAFPSSILTTAGGGGGYVPATCDQRTIILPFDTSFQCSSAIPSDFRTITPFGTPNPAIAVQPINCVNGQTDSLLITFLNPFTTGITYLWVKKGFDGNTLLSECGTELPEGRDTVKIFVPDTTTWRPYTQDSLGCALNSFSVDLMDSIYCWSIANDGSDFILKDANNTIFPIASAYGYCTPGGFKTKKLLINLVATANVVGPVYLLLTNGGGTDGNTISNNCGRDLLVTDTIAILGVDNKIKVDLGSDQTVCSNVNVVLNTGYTGLNYQWFNGSTPITGATSSTYTPTTSGTYSVHLNSSSTCTGADTVVVNIFQGPVDVLGSDISQCVNDPKPTFDAGNAGASYQWFFNNAAISGATNQTYTAVGAGWYTVQMTIGGVCTDTFGIAYSTVSAYVVNTLSNQTICAGAAFPTLDAGNPGAAFQWYNGSNAISGATSQTYVPTQAGTYSVHVGTGTCQGTGTMDLTVVALPVVTLANASICDYDPLPTLDAGNTGASFAWSSGATSQTYTPTTGGTYTVTVTVNPGCSSSASMNLTVKPSPVFSIADTTICSDGSATLDAQVAGASYAWSNNATTQTISTSQAGTYSVAVNLNGCLRSDTATVAVNNYPSAPVVTCNPSATATYKYVYKWTAIAGTANYEVSEDGGVTWIANNPVDGTESHGTNSPKFLVRAIGSGLCKTGATSEPIACDLTVYNAISPNGDNKNDVFLITNIEQYPNNTVQIFNRWGKEVFNENGYDNTSKVFTGKNLPDGVYFYIISKGDGTKNLTGTVNISR